jgi:hypothetical protein
VDLACGARAGSSSPYVRTLARPAALGCSLRTGGRSQSLYRAGAKPFERRRWADAYPADLDLVFCHPDGSALGPNVVGRRFDRRRRTVPGLPAIGLHGLRHTHATLLLEDGVDVKTVSERLGHDSIPTTLELYGHVTPRRGRSRRPVRGAAGAGPTARRHGRSDDQRVGPFYRRPARYLETATLPSK